ncbi:hypothetical protein LDENG_00058990 [Lucifuga dentata]|nr:hypothetical protein LDENG_00058990 [Lucifuga dentata]
MSGSAVNLQAQVESVLGALVKVATVELTKLFESRYRASAVDVGHSVDIKEKSSETRELLFTGNRKPLRSIGVQVDQDNISPPSDICGSPFLSNGDCMECRGEEEEEGNAALSDSLLAEDDDQVDPCVLPLKEKDVAETVDTVQERTREMESLADSDPKTETVLPDLSSGSLQSCPTKQKPLVIHPDTSDVISGSKVKFVCPLILKAESPAPKLESIDEPVQAEPQQASVSTAKGTAYSPSFSDGAMAPSQVGIWERIHTETETKNNLHLKLKLTPLDQKLMRPCAVHLVNLQTVPESGLSHTTETSKSDDANQKMGLPLPKDLRIHQGLHTGHRLCCFTRCEKGVWRLQNIVTHSRDGYTCTICRKKFGRRKILRRHERFHTGEKPYSCSQCPKTFALRKSLRRHLRFHTGERPHDCTQCGKRFRLRDNLKAHLRFHTGEKPFRCTVCSKTFRIARNLEKHNLTQCGAVVASFRTIAGM